MTRQQVDWSWERGRLSLGLDRLGEGRTVLMLPALSSISTRGEMRPLQQRLAQSFDTVALDWPGFGDLPRPAADWRPDAYDAFLAHVLAEIVPRPFAIVAAGHATGYVLRHLAQDRHPAARLVFLSPTWRGPLPTMMGGDRSWCATLARAIDPPVLGPMLYGLNVNRWVVGMMARGHVYADPAWLTGARMAEKRAVTRAAGARHGSARFVTGRLDPFSSRDQQLAAARQADMPVLNLFADGAPPKSRSEMEALAVLQNIRTMRLPQGKLSFYEEFPDATAEAVVAFLADEPCE